MLHRRPRSRIKPAVIRRSRGSVLLIVASLLVLVAAIATAALERTVTEAMSLAPAGPYRVESSAGPIQLWTDDTRRPVVDYRASWLVSGPSITSGHDVSMPVDVALGCPGRLPCRVATTVSVATGAEVDVTTVDEPLLVGRFSGSLTVRAEGSGAVSLGRIDGPVVVRSGSGSVSAPSLTSAVVDVESEGGAVELGFAAVPEAVSVKAGTGSVTVRLPDGMYDVTVRGASTSVVDVATAAGADHHVFIEARGPVRIESVP